MYVDIISNFQLKQLLQWYSLVDLFNVTFEILKKILDYLVLDFKWHAIFPNLKLPVKVTLPRNPRGGMGISLVHDSNTIAISGCDVIQRGIPLPDSFLKRGGFSRGGLDVEL